jgi:hypothetical protein
MHTAISVQQESEMHVALHCSTAQQPFFFETEMRLGGVPKQKKKSLAHG